MKQVKLKNKKDTFLLVGAKMMFAIAITLVFASCGSENTNKQQEIETPKTKTEKVATSNEKVNISDHYTAVTKPNIAYIEDWMIPTDGILAYVNEQIKGVQTRMSVGGMTWAQYESYMKTLEKHGMTKNLNSSVGDVNNFENSSVRITLDHDDGKKLGDNLKKSWLGIYIEKK